MLYLWLWCKNWPSLDQKCAVQLFRVYCPLCSISPDSQVPTPCSSDNLKLAIIHTRGWMHDPWSTNLFLWSLSVASVVLCLMNTAVIKAQCPSSAYLSLVVRCKCCPWHHPIGWEFVNIWSRKKKILWQVVGKLVTTAMRCVWTSLLKMVLFANCCSIVKVVLKSQDRYVCRLRRARSPIHVLVVHNHFSLSCPALFESVVEADNLARNMLDNRLSQHPHKFPHPLADSSPLKKAAAHSCRETFGFQNLIYVASELC